MPTNVTGSATPTPEDGERIAFDYIKSPLFRSIHADGLIGGITPSGLIHFALYCERAALPQRQVHNVTTEGALGEVIAEATVTRNAIVREMDVDAFITLEAAQRIRDWFAARVIELEERNEMIAKIVGGSS